MGPDKVANKQKMQGLEVHEAASMGDRDALEDYISSGKFDLNMKDPEWKNRAPLHWACARGFVDCVRVLLDYGADGTSRMDMGWTPAHCAAEAGKLNCLRALHTAGVSVCKKDKYKDKPVDVAKVYNHMDCVRFLIQVEKELKEKTKGTEDIQNESDSDFDSSEDGSS